MQWSTQQPGRSQVRSCARYFGRCSWPSPSPAPPSARPLADPRITTRTRAQAGT